LAAPRRRRRPVSRLIALPALALIAAALLVRSAAALAAFAANADTRDLAVSIEQGEPADGVYLARFVAAHGLDRPSADCGDAITRSRLTITLAALAAATKGADLAALDAAEKNALQIAGERLRCNPLDGNAWLRFAMVEVQASGPSKQALDALRLSYWAAPAESWIVFARLPFATGLYLAGASGFENEYLEDLRHYVDWERADRVAHTYVATDPRIRALLHPLIAEQPERRRKELVALIDQFGMVF
jgi:hypothetical protein